MKYFYKGNLNLPENRYVQNDIEYYFRGSKEFAAKNYDILAIKTHCIREKESLEELIRKYVLPVWMPGDILVISSKVVSMCQGQTVSLDSIHLSLFAKFMGLFYREDSHGYNIAKPVKFQLVLNLCGYKKVIKACISAVIGKVRGQKGNFYEKLPPEIAGIDGFYEASSFSYYWDHAILMPLDEAKTCQEIEKKFGIHTVISDTNDREVNIYGETEPDRTEDFYQKILENNPAGQDDEQTPFIIISSSGIRSFRPYVQVEEISEEEYSQWKKQMMESRPQPITTVHRKPGLSYYFRIFCGIRLKKLNHCLEVCRRRSGKTNLFLIPDMLISALLFGAGYYDYMWFDFALQPYHKRNRYVTRFRSKKIISSINTECPESEDKYLFAKAFPQYMKRRFVSSKTDRESFLTFLRGLDGFILKPVNGSGGDGIRIYRGLTSPETLYTEVSSGPKAILEELVVQHPDLARLNDSSVNTYRLVTICLNGNAHLIGMVCRLGRNSSEVDNICAGGLACSVDFETETINTSAYDDDLHEFTEHPDSHVMLKGYKLPHVKLAVEMCLEAAVQYESYGVRLVGWDVAARDKDVVLIESNTYPAYDLWQRVDFGGESRTTYQDVQILLKKEGG